MYSLKKFLFYQSSFLIFPSSFRSRLCSVTTEYYATTLYSYSNVDVYHHCSRDDNGKDDWYSSKQPQVDELPVRKISIENQSLHNPMDKKLKRFFYKPKLHNRQKKSIETKCIRKLEIHDSCFRHGKSNDTR